MDMPPLPLHEANTPTHRKNKRKKGPVPRKLVAVLIKPAEGKTYAELLKGVKAQVKPSDHQTDIRSIRKTKEGAILLELDRNWLADTPLS